MKEAILICQQCGEELKASWDQCPSCATPTATGKLTCPQCGYEIKKKWKLCPQCKNPLTGWTTPTVEPTPPGDKKSKVFVSIIGNDETGQVRSQIELPIMEGEIFLKRYTIRKPLGVGGFGAVYLALDSVLNEQIALKIVVTGEGKAERASEQLLHEYKLRDRISDISQILKVHDPRFCEYKNLSLLLLPMEYADGGSFRNWLVQNPKLEVRCKKGLELFRQACQGVKAIHQAELVHLDLKPENILIVQGKAKIADFGIGRYGAERFGDNPDQLLRQGIGTPQYMSPEQFKIARQKDIGPASDIYSLGIILYELLDGNLPFDGSPLELKEKHLTLLPKPLSGVGERWWRIIDCCLQKAPTSRYSDLDKLMSDLGRATEGATLSVDVSCPKCGKINENFNAKECLYCHANLSSLFRSCPECARDVRLDIEICPGCGKGVAAYYLLLNRKKKIEKLKDEDPVAAIDLLETVLRENSDDYHDHAMHLVKDLRQKQSQISQLITEATKAFSENLLEKALEKWQEILKLIPRHRVANENAKKLNQILDNYNHQKEQAMESADLGMFEEAEKLLNQCLELIPSRHEIKELLANIRKNSQQFKLIYDQASAAIHQKSLLKAQKLIDDLLSYAPKSKKTLDWKRQVNEKIKKVNELMKRFKQALTQAEFNIAQNCIDEIEKLESDIKNLSDIKEKLPQIRKSYDQSMDKAQKKLQDRDLTPAETEVKKAIQLCPQSEPALALLKEIESTLSKFHWLMSEAESSILSANFDMAKEQLEKAKSLWRTCEDLDVMMSKITSVSSQYQEELKKANELLQRKNYTDARAVCARIKDICPNSSELNDLFSAIKNGTEIELRVIKNRRETEYTRRIEAERKAQERRESLRIFFKAFGKLGVFILLLGGIGIGGFYFWKWLQNTAWPWYYDNSNYFILAIIVFSVLQHFIHSLRNTDLYIKFDGGGVVVFLAIVFVISELLSWRNIVRYQLVN